MSDYEKLKKIYDEIEELYSESGPDSSKFKGWEDKLERFIIKKYGKDSDEIKKVRSILKRENVIIIANSDVEMPSDLQGVVYTNENNWEVEILRGLRDIGYNIDMNKL